MSDDRFWHSESRKPVRWHPRGKRGRHKHDDPDRDLTYDEVYSPELLDGSYLGDMRRGQGFLTYKLIKRAGLPLLVVTVVVIVLGLVVSALLGR